MLLHDVADRLNTIADHLPLPDQIRADPAIGEVLEDEVRRLAGLLTYMVGETAFRHRAAAHYPHELTATDRRSTLALARAAQPAGAALAALGTAVHYLGRLSDLPHQPPGPARDHAITIAHQALVNRIAAARGRLAQTARMLRSAADTQATPAVTAPVAPAPPAPPSRTRSCATTPPSSPRRPNRPD
ncbi:hypothetical protein [Streptomyces europaeiscabiei]|uniref:hypothetical protein n=1 Tax=Streptomyces europaeiscabiei TaxID=146819 RepID=UPI0029AC3D33|nr:hypothetical protein [Streptomyces europaeiscabiei]MDX2763003.1 hypothetical protein [Streptomyces europaeiscabiei]